MDPAGVEKLAAVGALEQHGRWNVGPGQSGSQVDRAPRALHGLGAMGGVHLGLVLPAVEAVGADHRVVATDDLVAASALRARLDAGEEAAVVAVPAEPEGAIGIGRVRGTVGAGTIR
jgi:hypothetical protein